MLSPSRRDDGGWLVTDISLRHPYPWRGHLVQDLAPGYIHVGFTRNVFSAFSEWESVCVYQSAQDFSAALPSG